MNWNNRKTIMWVLYGLVVFVAAFILYIYFKDLIDNKNLLYIVLLVAAAVVIWYLYNQLQKQKRKEIYPKQAMDAFEENLIKDGAPSGWVRERGLFGMKYKQRIPSNVFRWMDKRQFSSPAGGKFYAAEYQLDWGDSPGIGVAVFPLSEGLQWVKERGYSQFEHISLQLWLGELNHKRRFPFDHSSDKVYQILSNLGDMDNDSARMVLGSHNKGGMMSLPMDDGDADEQPQGGKQWQRPTGSE